MICYTAYNLSGLHKSLPNKLDKRGSEEMKEGILSPEQLHTLLTAFKKHHSADYQLVALGYFGSYARNCATAESDVDIVFDTDAPNLFMTVMLKQDLEQALGRPVDLLQLRGLPNSRLKLRIEQEAVYV
jgi:predicted nucleotidyltransferase